MFKKLWEVMGSYEELWGVMGSYGELWGVMGSYGMLWGVMGHYFIASLNLFSKMALIYELSMKLVSLSDVRSC
jgi:hypothetical protein